MNKRFIPDWQAEGLKHAWMPYTQMKTAEVPLPVSGTSGVRIRLADGRELLDGFASWWTACHGYNHPHLLDAVQQQLKVMPHVMFGGLQHEPAMRLARRLADLLPGDLSHVFFSDSGSVAVEVAMKTAVQFHRNRNRNDRNRFITFRHSYHGDTTGAMALSDPDDSMHARFRGFLLQQYSEPIPVTRDEQQEFRRFVSGVRDQTAAIVIEPLLQAAGGMRTHPPESLRFLRSVADESDVLLIADELATGFGRTGSMFAVNQADIVPDIICLGKALTGGITGLAATVASEKVFDAFLSDDEAAALMHGPTFMANPLACAAANASLDLFADGSVVSRVSGIEKLLTEQLAGAGELSGVSDTRVLGAVGALQLNPTVNMTRLRRELISRNLWIRPFGDVVYVMPALIITEQDLTALTEGMLNAVKAASEA